jgi:hypothetical protein
MASASQPQRREDAIGASGALAAAAERAAQLADTNAQLQLKLQEDRISRQELETRGAEMQAKRQAVEVRLAQAREQGRAAVADVDGPVVCSVCGASVRRREMEQHSDECLHALIERSAVEAKDAIAASRREAGGEQPVATLSRHLDFHPDLYGGPLGRQLNAGAEYADAQQRPVSTTGSGRSSTSIAAGSGPRVPAFSAERGASAASASVAV